MASTHELHLHIPAAIAEAIRLPEERMEEALMCELAVALYAQGLLGFGKARAMTTFDKHTFGIELAKRGISRHYDELDLADDLHYARRQ